MGIGIYNALDHAVSEFLITVAQKGIMIGNIGTLQRRSYGDRFKCRTRFKGIADAIISLDFLKFLQHLVF